MFSFLHIAVFFVVVLYVLSDLLKRFLNSVMSLKWWYIKSTKMWFRSTFSLFLLTAINISNSPKENCVS